MNILGIETSCDETAAALLEVHDGRMHVLKNKTASQIDIHKKYGGVVPEIAGRLHAEKIIPLVEETLKKQPKPDAIAVTTGPGLVTGLLVGATAAQTLSYATNIPLVGVNHLEGHIHSVELAPEGALGEPIANFPAMALVVSGGHTELILMKNFGKYKLIGQTKDDAVGECFDKVGKILGLPYPGGQQVAKWALQGKRDAIKFPRPMLETSDFNFSFSGLKTAVLYHWQKVPQQSKNDDSIIANICASFEQAAIDVIIAKTLRAAQKYQVKTLLTGGGVAANQELQNQLQKLFKKSAPQITFWPIPKNFCGDNAAMIAAAGLFNAKNKKFTDWKKIKINSEWELI
ncbi:MAG TPA: tRNA (adenosine(37)-N6)-threonylcarbamoyltransferase complex transferase subunit TsaD [Candidatus Magasanikbacteria bacterium]|nr:tRNA (adenosine(37)-N6)-threonylcarbamoyltransferase complex transferase subunit TsaD [Candidatus Magasanikbacteria bacterium]